MKKNKTALLIITLFILIITPIIYLQYTKINKYTIDKDKIKEEETFKENDIVNYEEIINNLKKEYNNNDVVGILEINNTEYIVPIMQGEDNDYYLNHTPDGKKNYMGSIYLDFRVDIDKNKKLLIYGHNSSNIDMPFKILEEYYNQDYYKTHKYIEITTSKEKKKYEIFSVHIETEDFSYMKTDFSTDEEHLKHIQTLKSRSMYDTGVSISKSDETIILQTCSTHKDYSNYSKKYLLIVAKRIK